MATWADCAGCGERPIDFEQGSGDALGVFDMSAFSWKDIYVQQNKEESLKKLHEAGGTSAILSRLHTNDRTGVPGTPEDITARHKQFGENRFPEPPFESWFSIFFETFTDLILIILIIAAVVSIIIESIEHPERGWIDGVAIMIAVLIVASVTATNDYNKQLQFRKLSKESANLVEIRVVRSGVESTVKVAEVVVGDVILVDTGAKLPADGLVLRSNDLKCNESELTGESDEVHKDAAVNPFLLAGTTVTSGTCTYVATAVGIHSLQGQIKADVAKEAKDTPLQEKLDILAQRIGYVGIAFAILTFIAMMAIKGSGKSTEYTWQAWTIHSFIYAVTIIVVAIPEGLPLAVTISLAFSTGKMLTDKNLIRELDACEIMGNATDICTDKTGTLTENAMTAVELWAGGNKYVFSTSIADGAAHRPAVIAPTDLPAVVRTQLRDHLSLNSTAALLRVAKESLNKKSKSSRDAAAAGAAPAGVVFKEEVKGSKTEGAGIKLVNAMGYAYDAVRTSAEAADTIVKQYAFSSERKMMSTIVKLGTGAAEGLPEATGAAGAAAAPGAGVRVLSTGGSDMVLSRCVRVAQLRADGSGYDFIPLTPALANDLIATVITPMAAASLRTIALAYCDYPSVESITPETLEVPETGLTLFAILGIKDPLRAGVPEAVRIARDAGVKVRMVTGDNIITARAIAEECGIFVKNRPDQVGEDIVLEGPTFRKLTPAQLDVILPRLAVLARSSPKDKMILVKRLNGNLPRTEAEWKEDHPDADWETQRDILLPGYYDEWKTSRTFGRTVHRSVVGVTGDGTNDAPALKAADVGLSMGISGTEVAKDASKIIITDDNFASIVSSIKWGRSVYDNVQCFLQFQLTVNVVALFLTFISAVMQQDPPLNPIMMLWVNLIMDTMGALALATQQPSPVLLKRKPYASSAFLISNRMWRHILIQGVYQLILLLVILAVAEEKFGINLAFLAENGRHLSGKGNAPTTLDVTYYRSTFIFNMFVFCQIFNEVNARSLDNRYWSIWADVWRDRTFIAVIVISIGVQAIIVELGGDFTKTTGLIGMHWLYSILLAAITLPLGFFMRLVPVWEKVTDHAVHFEDQFAARMREKEAAGGSPIAASARGGSGGAAGAGAAHHTTPSFDPTVHVPGMPVPKHAHGHSADHHGAGAAAAASDDATGISLTPLKTGAGASSGSSSSSSGAGGDGSSLSLHRISTPDMENAPISQPFSPTNDLPMVIGVQASPAAHRERAMLPTVPPGAAAHAAAPAASSAAAADDSSSSTTVLVSSPSSF